jgi:hypothetical protein
VIAILHHIASFLAHIYANVIDHEEPSEPSEQVPVEDLNNTNLEQGGP